MSVIKRLSGLLMVFALLAGVNNAYAVIETYEFDSVEQREQFSRMNDVLRCPLCQNQSIGESNAPIANDLRREVHRLITDEQASDSDIVDFMLVRYGDFVLYKPPLDARTAALWFGPLFILLIGLFVLFRVFRSINFSEPDEKMNQQDQETLAKILGGKQS
ncbi:cytochrome c-type biogenesis protein [Endozoicomonas lisbonensis]|uniref:Cytochrome c-type biogenesis protein n=1 Tax=Endozoicomonas lisbonensis TaxID=3120522 RepID=A0ABV2SQ12_9GAMM